jgi:hypothetical protein
MRERYLMAEAVLARLLRTAAQFLSNDIEEIVDWVESTLE